MDRIAAAGVSKERIYGHFGNKDGLFAAVINDALDDLLAVVTLPDNEQADTGSLLREYVEQVSRYHRNHPEFLRLLLWEALEKPYPADPASERVARYREKVKQFAQRVGLPPDQAAPCCSGSSVWPPGLTSFRSSPRSSSAWRTAGKSSKSARWTGPEASRKEWI